MTYSEKLKDPRWQKKRLEIFKRDKWTCQKCGDDEITLNIHHLKYQKGKAPWESNKKDLITLCEHCHKLIERFKKRDDFDYNKLKIYKSYGYEDGTKIMFTILRKTCSIGVFDENFELIKGYDFVDKIPDIIKILQDSQK